mgnify:CR=1 FL=1|jgi:hypothetical protein
MGKEAICPYCNEVFQVGGRARLVTCPCCGCEVPGGLEDWREAYMEDIHRPILKPGGGEKADRTHSRQQSLKRKIAKANREFWRYRTY